MSHDDVVAGRSLGRCVIGGPFITSGPILKRGKSKALRRFLATKGYIHQIVTIRVCAHRMATNGCTNWPRPRGWGAEKKGRGHALWIEQGMLPCLVAQNTLYLIARLSKSAASLFLLVAWGPP